MIKQKYFHQFGHFLNYKVNSWQHEMEMSIRMNSKKIFENGNETIALKGNISEIIIQEKVELSLQFDKEKTGLNEKIKELNKSLKEDMMSFSKNLVKINQELTEAKNRIHKETLSLKNELAVNVEKEMTLLKTEFSKNFAEINQELSKATKEIISLKNENEDLKIVTKRMNDEIVSLKGDLSLMEAIAGWKVCTLQVIFLLKLLICFH